MPEAARAAQRPAWQQKGVCSGLGVSAWCASRRCDAGRCLPACTAAALRPSAAALAQADALAALQDRPAALAGEQWEALGQRLRLLEQGVQVWGLGVSGRVRVGRQLAAPAPAGRAGV